MKSLLSAWLIGTALALYIRAQERVGPAGPIHPPFQPKEILLVQAFYGMIFLVAEVGASEGAMNAMRILAYGMDVALLVMLAGHTLPTQPNVGAWPPSLLSDSKLLPTGNAADNSTGAPAGNGGSAPGPPTTIPLPGQGTLGVRPNGGQLCFANPLPWGPKQICSPKLF